MAKLLLLLLLLIPTLTLTLTLAVAEQQPPIYKFIQSQQTVHPKKLEQKISHLRFYWHDIVSGSNPTSVTVARGPTTNTSSTAFGQVNMLDDPITSGPTMDSQLVGRAQGLYASASQETLGLMMAMNFAFMSGKYNGSTITVMGRNEVFQGVREMPVVGGSGLFRFATGYVQAKTHSLDLKTRDATVQYDCYVRHY